MTLNIIDWLSLGIVAFFGGIQFLRSLDNLSLIFYETIGIIFACYLSNFIFKNFSYNPFFYLFSFVIILVFAFFLARFLNNLFSFSFGIFTYFFGFFLGIIFGWALCHAVLKTILIFSRNNPELIYLYKKSIFVSQILFFGFFKELLAFLTNVRHNIFRFN
ncbi:MAG: hypothetical protein N2323_05885 [candidate division WOR-3 bacterium]|nr:hypothetical protein [candidate division WOR-3 bacterium]